MAQIISGFWTFFCNPKIWEIDLFLATNKQTDTFQVNEWHEKDVKPGQLGIIRVGIDYRTKEQLAGRQKLNSGIYAIVEITGDPEWSMDVSDEFYVKEEDRNQKKLRVRIRYLKNLLDKPLLLQDLKQNPIVKQDDYLIDGFQRATMPLKEVAYKEIVRLRGGEYNILNNIEPEDFDTIDDIAKIELKYQFAIPQVKEIISKRIERGNISSAIKKLYEHKCKVCEAIGQNYHAFKKRDGEYYIETHHIVPVANLQQGSLGISNLITLCANHHREFHFGDTEIIENTNEQLVIKMNGQTISIEKKKLTKT